MSRVYRWGALWGQFWAPDWPGATQLLQRFRGTRQMMGLLPTDIGPQGVRLSLFWSIRHDALPAWRAAPIGQWKDQLLALWPEAAPVVDQVSRHEDLSVATYRHTWPRGLAAGPYSRRPGRRAQGAGRRLHAGRLHHGVAGRRTDRRCARAGSQPAGALGLLQVLPQDG
ncbi:hypothetical protein G6F68_012787 [Rhizopus microsporus]|nr:hypothetical protein G6F68_012787 [Rhizopus microsporus]